MDADGTKLKKVQGEAHSKGLKDFNFNSEALGGKVIINPTVEQAQTSFLSISSQKKKKNHQIT